MNPSRNFHRRDVADVQPWAETCGQIRPLLEEKDGAAAEVHHLQITQAKLHYLNGLGALCPLATVLLMAMGGHAATPDDASARSVKNLKLRVSANGRYFVDQNDKPFFYLGDTCWLLFQRLNREELDEYLKDRAAKGFTVIQARSVQLAKIE